MSTTLAHIADRSPTVSDLSATADRAADYARQARAANTRRAYAAAWSDFTGWCGARGLVALPAEAVTVGLYLADQAQAHKVSTLRVRLVAISEAHRLQGHNLDTRHPAIRDVWAGIRRSHGTAPVQKAAATSEIIRDLVRVTGQDGLRALRDRALVLIGFAAALRRSELVALDVQDVTFRPEGVVLRLRRSKTDQEGAGVEVAIPCGQAALTCPVRALQAWLEAAEIGEITSPLFFAINKAGRATPNRLSDRDVARVVKRLVEAAGYDPADYAGHSLRSGFATTAARAGVPEAEIMRQTRHRSLAVMRAYVRRGGLFLGNAAGQVGL
jgi:site-specific recombinase XerD